MKSPNPLRKATFAVLAIFLISGIANADHLFYFTANLEGGQENPPVSTPATGFGRVTLDTNANFINVSVFYDNLSSGLTLGHIHGPAPPGSNSGIVWDLNPTTGVTSGSVMNAQFTATPQNVADLFAGLMYFNIHTENFGSGEIRGQILIDSPFVATLDGNQQNPNVSTNGTGFGAVSVNENVGFGLVTVGYTNLSADATLAHIHQGPSGLNGPIICDLMPPPVPSGGVGDFRCDFTPEQVQALQNGLFYFNIHTSNFPNGEIRGQIQRQNSNTINFDLDRKTDISIFRPGPGEWWYERSADLQINAFQFGDSLDIPIPNDFTGDGLTDIAFFRPASGEWFVLRSEDNSFFAFPFGTTDDIPVPGDYDGDGKADPSVFRPSSSTWFINRSSDDGTTIQPFGLLGDVPVVGDYDGDGKDDLAIFRPPVAEWFIQDSSTGNVRGFQFGDSNDDPVPSDYTGDGRTDVGFFRPSTGNWFILRSEDDSFFSFPFGTLDDIPVPGDYDGDGRSDPAVFRPSNSTWFLNQTTDGVRITQFGLGGDIPLPD